MQFDVDLRIDVAQSVSRRFQFAATDVLCPVKYLPLQIRKIDVVEIDNANCSYTCCRKIEGGRGPKPAGADAQNACCLQPALPISCHFGHDKVTRIALQFLSAQVHVAHTLIIDNASLHAPSEILAQKSCAVAPKAFGVIPADAEALFACQHHPESFRGYNSSDFLTAPPGPMCR